MDLSQEEIRRLLPTLTVEAKKELLAALEERAILQARTRFLPYIEHLNPMFVRGRHHELVAEHLEAVDRGDIKRLMVFMPPRASKSMMISQYFPSWYIGRHPTQQILSISYNIDLVSFFGRFVRNTVSSDDYRAIFPKVELSTDSRASDRWMTTAGGVYNAVGIGGGIAGKGASLGIIDDPLNEQDAWSKAKRDHVIQWFPGGFLSRLMPGGKIIILMTRWHEDDLAGWLIRETEKKMGAVDPWTILNIPAIVEEEKTSVLLDLPIGSSFWPKHPNPPKDVELSGWSVEELMQKKAMLPPYQWDALYMQRPSTEGGNIIKKTWWKMWDKPEPPHMSYTFMSCDTAFSTKTSADFSVLTRWGVFNPDPDNPTVPHLVCLGMEKDRWGYPQLRKKIIEWNRDYKPDAIVIEKKASGQSLLQDLQEAGLPVVPFNPEQDKVARAWAATPLLMAGRVWMPQDTKTGWQESIMDDCARFPRLTHDDVVDAAVQAILWVKDGMFLVFHPDDLAAQPEPEEVRKKAGRGYW